ncbi:hypothetical protein ACFSO7_08415 [Bacillus sp. CGMCC 1.16607]|uniref:hypothetical protein n=1 Tax=Bacillus sp. CGMCC 1.16607 TaxID=3351842 RepID=UPI003626F58C
MEKNNDNYLFSTTTKDGISDVEFDVELYEYNPEWCCDGSPIKAVKNFDELISLLDEWED